MGGQDAQIDIVKSAVGRCTAIGEAVSFHGRVIGIYIVKLNSIFKIDLKANVPKQFSRTGSGWFGGSRSQDLLGEWRLKTRT